MFTLKKKKKNIIDFILGKKCKLKNNDHKNYVILGLLLYIAEPVPYVVTTTWFGWAVAFLLAEIYQIISNQYRK